MTLTTKNTFEGDGREKSLPNKNMKINPTRDMYINGVVVKAGETVECDDRDANYLINNGLAVDAKAKSKKTDRAVKGEELETRGD